MPRISISFLLFFFITMAFATNARADLTKKHVKIALKSVKFIKPKPKKGDKAAFVYKEGDAVSKALAEKLAASMDKKILSPIVTSSKSLDFSSARIVFITDAAMSDIEGISSAAQSSKAAAVGAQKTCGESGYCVITVETSPKVQIFLSEDAASKTGVSFSNAFKMLVKKH